METKILFKKKIKTSTNFQIKIMSYNYNKVVQITSHDTDKFSVVLNFNFILENCEYKYKYNILCNVKYALFLSAIEEI